MDATGNNDLEDVQKNVHDRPRNMQGVKFSDDCVKKIQMCARLDIRQYFGTSTFVGNPTGKFQVSEKGVNKQWDHLHYREPNGSPAKHRKSGKKKTKSGSGKSGNRNNNDNKTNNGGSNVFAVNEDVTIAVLNNIPFQSILTSNCVNYTVNRVQQWCQLDIVMPNVYDPKKRVNEIDRIIEWTFKSKMKQNINVK